MSRSTAKKMTVVEYVQAQRALAIKKARVDFYAFCRLLYPEFYKLDRLYLKDLCQTMQDFYLGEIDKQILLINMPPRHGKTFTATLFVIWIFGINARTKIITSSYNQTVSQLFAQQTRDIIAFINTNVKHISVQEIFPELNIKRGDSAKGFWSLAGSVEKNYLATSPDGTATGIGANYVLVDDSIKSKEDAYNQRILDKIWDWYNNTLAQRMENPRKQIVIMTRWASEDLAGKLLEKRKKDVHQITYKAIQDDGTMLCDEIMTHAQYLSVTQEMGKDIAEANYQQTPIDLGDQLYSTLKTYDTSQMPEFVRIISYTDTADQGSDYLATYIAGITKDGEAFIIDIYFTQEGMEVTEIEQARRFIQYDVNLAWIESNSGGRGFARAVKRILKEQFSSTKTTIMPFHQSKNKEARILSNSTWVMNHIYFPENWQNTYNDAYMALKKYKRKGKNEHDDIADALTGIAEKADQQGGISFLK